MTEAQIARVKLLDAIGAIDNKTMQQALLTLYREAEGDGRRFRYALLGARRAFAVKHAPERESGKIAQKSQDTMVSSLEKNVVYLADLLND